MAGELILYIITLTTLTYWLFIKYVITNATGKRQTLCVFLHVGHP